MRLLNTVTVVVDKKTIYTGKNIGRLYNKAAVEAIGKMRVGDKVLLDDVIVVGPDNRRRNIGTGSYTLFIF